MITARIDRDLTKADRTASILIDVLEEFNKGMKRPRHGMDVMVNNRHTRGITSFDYRTVDEIVNDTIDYFEDNSVAVGYASEKAKESHLNMYINYRQEDEDPSMDKTILFSLEVRNKRNSYGTTNYDLYITAYDDEKYMLGKKRVPVSYQDIWK